MALSLPTSCGGTSLPAAQPRCDGRSYKGQIARICTVPGLPGLDREAAHSGGSASVHF
jgi:hypothetical protein